MQSWSRQPHEGLLATEPEFIIKQVSDLPKKDPVDKTIITQVSKVDSNGEKQAFILFLSGPLVGKLHQLDEGETTLGRATEAKIAVNDNRISRKHLSIRVNSGVATITDLGSTNGTFVNGKRIQTHTLKDGDKIQISSSTIFKFAHQDNLENVFHQELYKMAVVDALTGVFNKRYFLDRLKEEFSHSKRIKQPLSLLMIDVDHFKNINDTHGHLAGDSVLSHLAGTVKQITRASDIFARYGGEEFAVLLRNSDEKGAIQMAERIRQTVEKSPAQFDSLSIPLTVSVGLATLCEGEEYDSPEAFLETADKFLYKSKEGGRNKTSSKSYG